MHLRPGFHRRQTDAQPSERAWASRNREYIDLIQAEVCPLLQQGNIAKKPRRIRRFFVSGDLGQDLGVAQNGGTSGSSACIYGKNQHLAILTQGEPRPNGGSYRSTGNLLNLRKNCCAIQGPISNQNIA